MTTKRHGLNITSTTSSASLNKCERVYLICTPLYNFTALEVILGGIVFFILLVLVLLVWFLTRSKTRRRCESAETIKGETNLELQDNIDFVHASPSHVNTTFESEPMPPAREQAATLSISTQTDTVDAGQCICEIHGAYGTRSEAQSKKKRYKSLHRGSKAFLHFYTNLIKSKKTDVDPIAADVEYSEWLSNGSEGCGQYIVNRESIAQDYQEIDGDLDDADLYESSNSEIFDLHRCSTSGNYQTIDAYQDFEYIDIPPPQKCADPDNVKDPPEYLEIFRSVDIDEQEYAKPADGHSLPPFPTSSDHAADVGTYSPELPEPPNNSEFPNQTTEYGESHDDDYLYKDFPPLKPLKKDGESCEERELSGSSQNQEDESAYEDMSRPLRKIVTPCSLKSQVDHDKELVSDGNTVHNSMSTDVYTIPNIHERENTKEIKKQLCMNPTDVNEGATMPLNEEHLAKQSTIQKHTNLPPKHVTLPVGVVSKNTHSNHDDEPNKEGKPRAATFDEEYRKNADTANVASFMKSLEGMLQERCKDRNAFVPNKETFESNSPDTNDEQYEPQDDYENIDFGCDGAQKDENENTLRPPSSIYEAVRDPLYDFVAREATTCDISDEQSGKDDEVSRAVVRRLPSPYMERKHGISVIVLKS